MTTKPNQPELPTNYTDRDIGEEMRASYIDYAMSVIVGRAGARLVQMRGRTFEGYVRVDSAALTRRSVQGWIRLARPYVNSLPPKNQRPGTQRSARK